jgi:hypothetical protein
MLTERFIFAVESYQPPMRPLWRYLVYLVVNKNLYYEIYLI